jgi:2'-5' RNA ligase
MINNNFSIRAFFAIDLPSHVKKYIFEMIVSELNKQVEHNRVRWTLLDKLHITLQFIPSIKIIEINKLIDQTELALKNEKPFHLKLGPIELFPNENKPKIISLHVSTDKDELTKLATLLGNILGELNYPKETRIFRPHLTLGKLSNYYKKNLLETIKIPQLEIVLVKEITLFESRREKSGVHYITLKKIPLKA